jgi:hypothetical protein
MNDGGFLRLARLALARDPRLAFVTAAGDAAGAPLRACTAAMLLGRPAVEVPTLFREDWPLDETLPYGQKTDLALRLLAAGHSGAVLDMPLGEAPRAELRPLYQKHQATLDQLAEEVLVVKEHWLRVTAERSRAVDEEERRLRAELLSLDEEAALLERCLERLA